MEDKRRSHESSVRHLGNFYTVVVGVALSNAVLNVVDASGKFTSPSLSLWLCFGAFLVTLVPFYHGAMRHLDSAYTEHSRAPRSGALMADFVILFLEACIFLALAVVVSKPIQFSIGIAILLTVDIVWGFAAHLAFSSKYGLEATWAKINLITVLGFVGLFWFEWRSAPIDVADTSARFALPVFVICAFRTVFDYMLAWKIYYPSE